MKRHLILIASCLFFSGALQPAVAVTVVPEGNRNASQPGVPAASAKRTREMNTTYEAKYQKIYNLLKSDSKLRSKIASVARTYGIDPVHIAGALIGEHTYNVDAYDRLQTYYVKAISYVKQGLSFDYQGETIGAFVKRPQFSSCAQFKDSLRLWACRENVWEQNFRGKTVGGKQFPDNRFSAVFFQPFYAGQSFGLGQLSPLIALQMTDMVNRYSGLPKLDADHAADVYKTIMDPDLTLPYMAAALKHSIDVYRRVADFDISQNPGITATLYNTGGADSRAQALANINAERIATGQELQFPEENYYGWLVNEKIDQLRSLF
ncbi:DUF1402 family protein [Phyllobacterium lublinensis]|uniref:DUF1402 family protein n=1 Tax=Phyllobacterium lublinensis TaxID=2875708 RepID=UPI001CCBF15F|nr:DUF1402 family protein [Phyllobacterium sp. 2063]MBZ9656971.1 DUF1402 family protein [Phyllobacterium sp. 2063]